VSTGTPAQPSYSTARLEAFSDGIFAIAATLLVLDLRVRDDVLRGDLGHALGQLWPNYAAYVVSFATIGIIWMNHHAQMDRIGRADRGLLTLNLVLLLFVSVIPFPTSLLARFLRAGSDQHVAAAVYSATLLAMGVSFYAMFTYARRTGLIVDEISPATARFLAIRNLAGLAPYAIAVGVAFVSAPASLALCGAVALYYLVPERLLGLPDA
jgi:TMEM175 potassium channel family protein